MSHLVSHSQINQEVKIQQQKNLERMRPFDIDFNPNEEVVTVSRIKSLDFLIREYPNKDLIPQFRNLQETYPCYRAVRGDGNCFYRAIAFLYLREANLRSFSSVFESIQNSCIDYRLDFEGTSFQSKLHDLYEKHLAPLKNVSSVDRQDKLAEYFNTSFVFDTIMVMYFRSLNYQYIKSHENKFSQYIDSPQTLEKVRKFGTDSEGIQYFSMADALNIQISIKITDQHALKSQDCNMNPYIKSYDLFFRPGHFDILYHKDSLYLRNISSPYQSSSLYQPKSYVYNQQNTQSYFQSQRQSKKYSPISPTTNQKDRFLEKVTHKPKQIEEEPRILPSKSPNPYMSLNTLRTNLPVQVSRFQVTQKKDQDYKSKLKESQIFKRQNTVPTQKYKAWEIQTKPETQSWRKIKQTFIVSTFLAVLGYFVFLF